MAFRLKSSWAALSRNANWAAAAAVEWECECEDTVAAAADVVPMAAEAGRAGGSINFVADRSVLQIANSILRRHRCGAIKQRPSRTARQLGTGGLALARALGFIRVSKLITASN